MKYKILVVEDELNARRGLIETTEWGQLDCEVVGEARNGQEGLELALALRPDIIITDEKMPSKSGLSMVEELGKHYRPQVIIISAFADFSFARRAIDLSVLAYLLKPFTDDDLYAALRKAIQAIEGQQAGVANLDAQIRAVKSRHHNVQEALSFIHEHYQENIGIREIADYVGVSESYVSHIFKEETQHTPGAYLVLYRMNIACKLLKDPNIKVYEVADAVGYTNHRYFSRLFKKHIGVTPYYYKEHSHG